MPNWQGSMTDIGPVSEKVLRRKTRKPSQDNTHKEQFKGACQIISWNASQDQAINHKLIQARSSQKQVSRASRAEWQGASESGISEELKARNKTGKVGIVLSNWAWGKWHS